MLNAGRSWVPIFALALLVGCDGNRYELGTNEHGQAVRLDKHTGEVTVVEPSDTADAKGREALQRAESELLAQAALYREEVIDIASKLFKESEGESPATISMSSSFELGLEDMRRHLVAHSGKYYLESFETDMIVAYSDLLAMYEACVSMLGGMLNGGSSAMLGAVKAQRQVTPLRNKAVAAFNRAFDLHYGQ